MATVVNGVRHDPNDVPRPVEAAERACYDLVFRERAFTKGSFSQVRRRIEGADAAGQARCPRIPGVFEGRAFIGTEVADSQPGFRLIRSQT